jgi:hypothetical protein
MYLTDENRCHNPKNRQADAELITELKAEADALGCCSAEDISNFAAHAVKDAARFLVEQNVNAIDRYRKGEVAAYIRIHLRQTDRQLGLAFLRIPSASENSGIVPEFRSLMDRNIAQEFNPRIPRVEWDESAVFLGITNFVHGPQDVIPSFAWLELAKERDDFRRDIFADLPSYDVVIEAGQVISERKTSSFGVGFSAGDCGSITSLIKDGSEVADHIEQDTRKILGDIAGEPDFVDMFSRLRLRIDEQGPWLLVEKSANNRFEILDMILCTTEGKSRTVEQVSHDRQIRSD